MYPRRPVGHCLPAQMAMGASEETMPKKKRGGDDTTTDSAATKLKPWAPGEGERVNRMVFIGRNLDRQALTASARACLAA